MKTVGFIGLGNMGMGMARNLLAKGFSVQGYARRAEVAQAFADMGGQAVAAPAEVARGASAVFLMVMNGEQVNGLLDGGLLDALAPGCALILTATIGQHHVQRIAEKLAGRGVDLIDTPVSGGKGGADSGTLTLMAAAPRTVLQRHDELLRAIGTTLVHVGEQPGMGQVAKACLQTLIGVSFEGLFEAMVLGAKAGLDAEVLGSVISHSFVGSRLTAAATGHIAARRFSGTGSHIATMHKDIAIGLEMAHELGVAMPATAVAMQMFQAGRATRPEGDNWCIVQLLEQMAAVAPQGTKP